jgi:hypothetical protein
MKMATETVADSWNHAAKELPDGWSIVATVERHAGTIELIDPSGLEVDCGPDSDETFDECVRRFVSQANGEEE